VFPPEGKRKSQDTEKTPVVKATSLKTDIVLAKQEVYMLNDAVVPVVPTFAVQYDSPVPFTSSGASPIAEARARAPTMERTDMIPRSRDKPVK